MSYILEALKKSERKRPPGSVPDLFTVHGPLPTGTSRRPLLATVGIAAFIGAVALGGWAWHARRDRPAQSPLAETAAPQPFRSAGVAQPEAVTPAPSGAAAPVPTRKPAHSAAAKVPTKVSAVPREVGHQAPGAQPESAEPARREAPAATVPAALQPGPAPAAVEATASGAVVQTAALPSPYLAPASPPPAAVAEPAAPPQQAAAEAPPADGRVVDVEELPQSVRAVLGSFTVSGHVWSEEPALRLVTVKDRIVREGGEAAPGVRLEEITQTGAVFTVRGWRFRTGF